MTDDLVKRLRDKNCCDATKCNCDEAADRIEALEKALGSMKAAFRVNMIRYANANDEEIEYVIQSALGEKKDA